MNNEYVLRHYFEASGGPLVSRFAICNYDSQIVLEISSAKKVSRILKSFRFAIPDEMQNLGQQWTTELEDTK